MCEEVSSWVEGVGGGWVAVLTLDHGVLGEYHWMRNSSYDYGFLLHRAFRYHLSSSQYGLNNVEWDLKHQIIIIIILSACEMGSLSIQEQSDSPVQIKHPIYLIAGLSGSVDNFDQEVAGSTPIGLAFFRGDCS